MFLQSYVCPVCTFSRNPNGLVDFSSSQGTSFFVGSGGIYLTARHVLEDAFRIAKDNQLEVGCIVKDKNGNSSKSMIAPVTEYEFAPSPYDIAIGKLRYSPASPLKIIRKQVEVWQDIATLGYPASVSVKEGNSFRVNQRAHRGYVQRCTMPQDMPVGLHPNGYELNFLLSPGLSGCPIFTTPDEIVIGIGVGSFKSEQVESELCEVEEDGTVFREKRIRIEQFGFAHAIDGLLDWKPTMFGGSTLLEIANL